MITRRFQNLLEELEGLVKNDFWSAPYALVAVSGGMDSMCLADLYYRTVGSAHFAIAHCNFNLRGGESDGDEALVREWAESRGVCAHFASFDTAGYAGKHGLSIEMAARQLRYEWFAELCAEHAYSYVSVAHHADDNAETLMLNLVRGTGLKGASGMKPLSVLPYSNENDSLRLMRPLLGFTRKQIEGYVYGHGVPFRNDSTNSSVEYRRNSIRHEVFPLFEKMNPSFVRTLNREMRYFADAEEIVSDWCRTASASVLKSQDGRHVIDTRELMQYSQWRYLLYHILEPFGFNSSVLASIEELLLSERTVSGKRFSSQSHILMTGREDLVVMPLDSLADDADESLVVNEAGTYRLGNVEFSVEVSDWTSQMPLRQPSGVLAFDASRLAFPFVCRKWKRGDWIIPYGMKGRKKVSDIFADLKWNEMKKEEAVIITDDEEAEGNAHVAALLGVRMDDRYRITEKTSEIIRIIKH